MSLAEAVAASAPTEWRYTAEGGANLVLSYLGACPLLRGRCLRLRKRKRQLGAGAGPRPRPSPAEEEDPAVQFGRRIVRPLLGEGHVPSMEPVAVPKALLLGLKERVERERPAGRGSEDEIDEDAERGVVVEDLVGSGSGFVSYEIKPKWSFLPQRPERLSPQTREAKLSYCRTCMLRTQRSPGGPDAGARASRYCPLQLFSPHPGAAESAVRALVALWRSPAGAGNSFRVFRGGRLVGPGDHEVSEADIQGLAAHVAASPALRRLAQLQALFDPVDIEGVAALTRSAPSTLSEPFALPELESLLPYVLRPSVAQEPTARELVGMYLLSMAFKDCSAFVRYQEGSGWKPIKLVDLDPKGVERWRRYVQVDESLRERFPKLAQDSAMESCVKLLERAERGTEAHV